ncbi:MAG TPA: hypothetical protein VMQ78_09105 [Candidatus Limnocylindria bacterium]|nr:hypothetical protein [Candidatus Limnocylindria bacterium]
MALNSSRDIGRPPAKSFEASQREQADALLRDLGADEIVIEAVGCRIEDDDVQSVVSRLRNYAEENPRIVLGALSALIAGGAVVAGRAVAKKRSAQRRKAAASKAGRKSAKARSSKRTLIEPHPGDKRYIRRDSKGRIKESVDVGRSHAADQRRNAKTRSKPGAGDKGDR